MPIIEVEDTANIVVIDHPSNCASVSVALKGATITSWKMFSANLLYCSPLADTSATSTTPIRGGIPICWPSFGEAPQQFPLLPKHGFARQKLWTYLGSEVDENEDIKAVFQLRHDEETLKMYPFKFTLQLEILLGMSYLQTSLQIQNHEEATDMPCKLLFHNYLHTDNYEHSVVTGLKDFVYTDQLSGSQETDRSAILAVGAMGEIDRVYRRRVYDEAAVRYRSEEMIALGDGGNADITLRAINLHDTVIWNPSTTKTLPDLPADDYKQFVCVELGTVSDNIIIKPGEHFIGAQRLVLRILAKMSQHIRTEHAKQANALTKTMQEEKKQIAKILPAKSQESADAQPATVKKDEDDAKEGAPDGGA